MDRTAIARVLEQIASYLELQSENPFRVRAFRTAAKAVGSLPGDPASGLADGSLAATKGVGPGTLAIIKELVEVGRSAARVRNAVELADRRDVRLAVGAAESFGDVEDDVGARIAQPRDLQ